MRVTTCCAKNAYIEQIKERDHSNNISRNPRNQVLESKSSYREGAREGISGKGDI